MEIVVVQIRHDGIDSSCTVATTDEVNTYVANALKGAAPPHPTHLPGHVEVLIRGAAEPGQAADRAAGRGTVKQLLGRAIFYARRAPHRGRVR